MGVDIARLAIGGAVVESDRKEMVRSRLEVPPEPGKVCMWRWWVGRMAAERLAGRHKGVVVVARRRLVVVACRRLQAPDPLGSS